ncbi:MAG: hypothetical protein ACFFDW_17725 [Candidatus Thorarchaeota archaeon]
MVKLDKIGFLTTFLGGLAGIVLGILNLVNVFDWDWYLGGPGLLGIFLTGSIVGPIIALVASGLALLVGLKTFLSILDFDLIIWGIIVVILGVLVFGIAGYIIILGGVLLIIARFTS